MPSQADVKVGDVNGNGIPDLVGLTPGSNGQSTLTVEIGNGDGTFRSGPSTTIASGADFSLAALNGDGKLDVLIGNQLYLGDGTGSFSSPITLAISNNGVNPTFADQPRKPHPRCRFLPIQTIISSRSISISWSRSAPADLS